MQNTKERFSKREKPLLFFPESIPVKITQHVGIVSQSSDEKWASLGLVNKKWTSLGLIDELLWHT